MKLMQGMTIASLKKHPALIPLYVCTFVGMFGAAGYLLRLALKSPDIIWTSSNKEPWETYRNKQYKFYSPNIDYSKIECHAPIYKEDKK